MVEIRVFLPKPIVRRIDRRIGLLGTTRSEVCRHLIADSLVRKPKENLT